MEQSKSKRPIIHLNETHSTNLYLRQLMEKEHVESGTIVTSDFQSAGRGQQGNVWYSSKGENLLFSFLVYPEDILAANQFIISRMVSLAVKRTLATYTENIYIKWPNDIYWKNKKIAGILIENTVEGKNIVFSIIGIGLNLNEDEFPQDLPNPISLRQITGINFDKEVIMRSIRRIYFQLNRELLKDGPQRIEHEYMSNLFRLNGYYWYRDATGDFQAKIENVLPSGHLVLSLLSDGKRRTYAFKEVQFIPRKK